MDLRSFVCTLRTWGHLAFHLPSPPCMSICTTLKVFTWLEEKCPTPAHLFLLNQMRSKVDIFSAFIPSAMETGNVTSPEFQVQTEQTTSHFIYLLNSIYMIGSVLLFFCKDIWPEVYWLNFWLGAACWIFFSKPSGVVYLRWSDILPSERGGWAESRNPGPGGWLVQHSIDVWCWPYSCMSLAHAERSKCLFGGLHALTHFNVSFHSQHTVTKPPAAGAQSNHFDYENDWIKAAEVDTQ